MKNCLFIFITLFSIQSASADNWKEYLTPDTLKTPELSDLSQKQRQRLGSAQLGTDFTLSERKRKADELFKHVGYMASVEKYQKLDGLEKNKFVLSKLANSFRLNGDYDQAEYYYSQFISDVTRPEDYLHYAEVLQINGKCEDATRWNKEYLAATLDTSRDVITDCDQLDDIINNEMVAISNAAALNSEGLDFSPVLYKDGVIFTSNRGVDRLTKKIDLWSKGNFTDLFYAPMTDDGTIGEIEPLSETVNHNLHDGTATFTPDGAKMIFSRSDEEGKNKDKVKELQLYFSQFDGEEWTEAEKLNICKSDFAYCHPTLSENGKKIYFTSNQMPGGYGGMDVWMSERVGGTWKDPVNLGPTVNTSGNELFPFFAADKTLYFASNGHRGLGGLDIFYVKQEQAGDDRSWTGRTNLGEPFNSNKDDFAFNISSENDKGFFTSNRGGGQGEDDIYQWEGLLGSPTMEAELVVMDKKDLRRLPFVNVTVVDRKTGEQATVKTDADGAFILPVDTKGNYLIQVEKAGYLPFDVNLSGKEMVGQKVNTLPLERKETFKAQGSVFDLSTNSPLPNTEVRIRNGRTGNIETLVSDDFGYFTFEASCDSEYEIRSSRDKFLDGQAIFSTSGKDCADFFENPKKNEVKVSLEPIELKIYEYSTDKNLNKTLNGYFLGSDELSFAKGQVIRLTNLYYDFDKYDIRQDAEEDLNRVYELLKTYKTMKIALLSHTDSRGRDRYNTRLSQKRAFSARDYLIAKGINPNRLSSVGVGEGLPVNDCTDGVECEEDLHQLNRRTEIKITVLDEPGIKIIRE